MTIFNAYEAATAWFSRGKDYGLKCASSTLNGMIFLSPTQLQLRGFAEAKITS
ncbi:MAG: hypothetical protein NT010_07135 [Proteobacteria bacterium]|nr:hypothetical protein [Pseudomonadota bacterium]